MNASYVEFKATVSAATLNEVALAAEVLGWPTEGWLAQWLQELPDGNHKNNFLRDVGYLPGLFQLIRSGRMPTLDSQQIYHQKQVNPVLKAIAQAEEAVRQELASHLQSWEPLKTWLESLLPDKRQFEPLNIYRCPIAVFLGSLGYEANVSQVYINIKNKIDPGSYLRIFTPGWATEFQNAIIADEEDSSLSAREALEAIKFIEASTNHGLTGVAVNG